ncbi:hypothetical protein NPIL_276211 [Nephila pilipes]|uniref:Uncharacterized protein n=1 Tax=Nephila pilipes TaxID=299642 RepID=A0A8X6UCC9_NEPPI|nr:hypothetical protein NPIL_276211 [Nephila pilipes]
MKNIILSLDAVSSNYEEKVFPLSFHSRHSQDSPIVWTSQTASSDHTFQRHLAVNPRTKTLAHRGASVPKPTALIPEKKYCVKCPLKPPSSSGSISVFCKKGDTKSSDCGKVCFKEALDEKDHDIFRRY